MSARWAILGAGGISADFAAGLRNARLGHLHAVGARDAGRARAFADAHGAAVAGETDEILARDDVDAVYVGTVHTTHAELAIAALEAGKAVLCEKPLTISPEQTEAVLAASARTGMPLLEAFKYRFGPFWQHVGELVASGAVGEVVSLESTLGSTIAERTGRLFDPAVAGGAILDVGCYPASLAIGVAAWTGRAPGGFRLEDAAGTIGPTGVDETASATLVWDGFTARIATAIRADLPRRAVVRGTAGELEIPNVWGSRSQSTATATLRDGAGRESAVEVAVADPMGAEADAVIAALRDGRTEVPEMPWDQTRATARALDEWRAGL